MHGHIMSESSSGQSVCAGVGSSSMMVQALKNLPQQQQLLICAATKLLGGQKQEPTGSSANLPTTSGLSGLPRKASLRHPSWPIIAFCTLRTRQAGFAASVTIDCLCTGYCCKTLAAAPFFFFLKLLLLCTKQITAGNGAGGRPFQYKSKVAMLQA